MTRMNSPDFLIPWLTSELVKHSSVQVPQKLQLDPLSGDAGLRRYYRLNTKPSLLVVIAPKTGSRSDSSSYFARLSTNLRDLGLPTPQILACDEQENCMCLQDFGSQLLLEKLSATSADTYYRQVFELLLRLQQIPNSKVGVSEYHQGELRRELELFPEWFISQLLGIELSLQEQTMLEQTFQFLEEQAMSQPQVLVHRDFHSRNIMVRKEQSGAEELGLIDFQDMVLGPITYDLVSLLRDCYILWSPQQVRSWVKDYANQLIELGMMPVTTEETWQRWFDCMGLQRHLKVLGVFARLFLRDNKSAYLKDLPLVWYYTLEIARQHPELEAFYQWSEQILLPHVKQQAWYELISPDQYPFSIYSS